jgi:uncharacterized protein YecT (DUF1311 family)
MAICASAAFVIASLLAAPAHAQDNPMPAASFNCAAAKTPDTQIICSVPALRRDDSRLASSFLEALSTHPGEEAVLRADERAWVATRNAMCGVARTTEIRDAAGGILQGYVACFETLYSARTLYLLALNEPADFFQGRSPGATAIIISPGSQVTFPPIVSQPNPAAAAASIHLAQSELVGIVTRIRALYPGNTGFGVPAHTDMTCELASKGVFPAALLQNGPCSSADRATYPRSPWGTPVTIYASWADNYVGGNRIFQVDFQLYGATPNPCSDLIADSLGSGQDAKLVRVWTAAGPAIDPQTQAGGAPACGDAGFDFRL